MSKRLIGTDKPFGKLRANRIIQKFINEKSFSPSGVRKRRPCHFPDFAPQTLFAEMQPAEAMRPSEMPLPIDHLTEAELIDLNRRIVERLKFLSQMRAHARMLDFSVGEKVTFQPDGRPPLVGILIRYNKKSVTVLTENGERWNVSPHLLRRVVDIEPVAPRRLEHA